MGPDEQTGVPPAFLSYTTDGWEFQNLGRSVSVHFTGTKLEIAVNGSATLVLEELRKKMAETYIYTMLREYAEKKPFWKEVFDKKTLLSVAAVLDARIRPKRKRKLLMAMGFSRNEARKLAFRGGADWRYRAEK